jgi:hypothetical protein
MRQHKRQQGLGMWGWIFVLGVMGFVTMVVMQLVPIYLNELAIERVVKLTAKDPGNANASPMEVRKAMQTRWDVEGINNLDIKAVQLVKTPNGRALAYEYDAKADLFYNLSIVAHFQNKFAMDGSGNVE